MNVAAIITYQYMCISIWSKEKPGNTKLARAVLTTAELVLESETTKTAPGVLDIRGITDYHNTLCTAGESMLLTVSLKAE